MSFEVEGKLIKKYDTENKTGTFQAREFVIEVMSGAYPQMVKFQLVQDRCTLIDGYEEGEMIKVHFDLRGREWNGKYFTNLNAWRIDRPAGDGGQNSPPPPAKGEGYFPSADDDPGDKGDKGSFDDLPF
jgi:single-strand DNA-binding protein